MRTSRLARWLTLAGLFMALAAQAADTAPLRPFAADYEVLRNGKELGRATLTLRDDGNGTWEFSSETHGTKGLAGMLGVDVVEKSTFRWRDGLPEGLSYRYAQQAAVKSRERSIDFDWNSHQARTRDGKSETTAPLQGTAMDRNLVTVGLMAALKTGTQDPHFPVVDKDRVADQHYRVEGKESLSLRSGPVEAMRAARVREDNPGKQTTIWFAPHLDWLPVQIEQVDKGETVTLRFLHGD
jgi:hypothetical protein